MEILIIVGGIVGVVLLLILGVMMTWKKVSQDKALVITGLKKRVIAGGGGFVVPLLERTDRLSLENIKIEVKTENALTEHGVGITADGVAVLKVKSDQESILSALEQFNTGDERETIRVIQDTAKDVLEGKLREIISKMSVEEIHKDREKFASQVQEVAARDLADMGLEIKAFTIRDINDENGYLDALGKKRIAEVKRDAEIAEAEAVKETKIKTAEAGKQGEETRLKAETQIAEASKEKELKIQTYRKEEESTKAIADLAYEIESNKTRQLVEKEKMNVEITKQQKEYELTEEKMRVELLKKEREIQIAEQETLRRVKELEATVKKQADAEKYNAEKQTESDKFRNVQKAIAEAEAIKVKGAAEADATRQKGLAEVEIIRERGKAEAEAMQEKAAAFKLYDDAAMAHMIIEVMPELAGKVAEPLSKVQSINIVDTNSGGSKSGLSSVARIPGYVTDIIGGLFPAVENMTGIDLKEYLKKGSAGASVVDQK